MLQRLEKNLTRETGRKTNYVSMLNIESSMVNHMELTLYKQTCDDRILSKKVYVFIGYEYTISYFDITKGCNTIKTGLVESVGGASSGNYYITIRTLPVSTNTNNVPNVTTGFGCDCVLNQPDHSLYLSSQTIDIPVNNITDIVYKRKDGTTNDCCSCCPPDTDENQSKKGVEVVLLGISSSICRAIVVNLKMIEENCTCDTAIRDVNLEVGNIYNMAYWNSTEKAIYEFDGKLISIQETDQMPSEDTIVRGCECRGLNNSIYNSKAEQRESYLTSDKITEDILLTFDISEHNAGEYKTVRLSQIRDCKLLKTCTTPDISELPDPEDPDNSTCNHCKGKPIVMKIHNATISLDPKTKNVEYKKGENTGHVSLEEIMKFYFGDCCC